MTRIALTGDLHYGFGADIRCVICERRIGAMLKSIVELQPDILVITGDIISHDQAQWEPALSLIRGIVPDIPVLAVMGNHDYWQSVVDMSLESVMMNQRRWLDMYDIDYLHERPFVSNGITIYGIDGWYNSLEPPTNDSRFLPRMVGTEEVNDHLSRRSYERLVSIPDRGGEMGCVMIATHFEPSWHPTGGPMEWLDLLRQKADILLTGHNHQRRENEFLEGMRLFNSGSDYHAPCHLLIDTGRL